MTTSVETKPAPAGRSLEAILAEWWPVILGFLLIYVPSVADFMAKDGLWDSDDQAHGPIILALVVYLLWQKQEVFLQALPAGQKTHPIFGGCLIVLGGVMYVLGRSQHIMVFETGALMPFLAGSILMTRGWQGLRQTWFAVLFAIFLIPLPGVVVDAATGPLKQYISIISENVLYYAGYPIGRNGVTIVIGQYQLLVADACSGLHSMFSLSALGFLYLYLMQYRNNLRNAMIVAAILPIAFVANIVRVMILILVTYHFGDEVGQGFIHGSTGMFLFVISLMMLFTFDSLLGKIGIFKDAPLAKKEA